MSIIRNIVGYLPAIIILLVSGAAFIGGILQNGVAEQGEASRLLVQDHEKTIGKISATMDSWYLEDANMQNQAWSLQDEAWTLAWEVYIFETDLTQLEIDFRLDRIQSLLILADTWIAGTNAYFIEDYLDSGNSQIALKEQSEDGYDWTISKTTWDSYEVCWTTTASAFMTSYGFPDDVVTMMVNYVGSDWTVLKLDLGAFWSVLGLRLEEEQTLALDNEKTAISFGERATAISQAVTIIAVATVLSSAMANRIEFRNSKSDISMILAELKGDESYIEPRSDKVANIVLPVALVLSIMGLLLALI